MRFGPILDRELTRLARQRGSYGSRTGVPLIMLALIGINALAWHHYNQGPSTVQQVALFGRLIFAQFALVQVIATLSIVPEYVDRSIAEEKDRKSLTFLLTTQLSSGSIVVGKLAAGLWHYLTCLLAGLPVVLLLPLFGGIEPELVVLTYAGVASTALFVAGLSVVNSVIARRSREARRMTLTLIFVWLFGPVTLSLTLARFSPGIYAWLRPANELMLASSPLGVLPSLLGILPGGTFLESLGLMIGIQLTSAALLILGAVALLRPVWRRHGEGVGHRRGRRARSRPRPDCGDQPLLWKELHVGRTRGVARLIIGLACLMALGTLGVTTYFMGIRAAEEVLAVGYGATEPSPGRSLFNQYLRFVTAILSFLYALILTDSASKGIAVEQMQETWLSLIATPVDGWQILRAKMLGAVWHTRGWACLIVALWSVGLIVGSVHPLGFMAALIGLVVSTWFLAAVGVYAALRAGNPASASNLSLLPVLVLCLSGLLPNALPEPVQSVVLGAGSIPFVESLLLFSYGEVHQGLLSSPSPTLTATGIDSGEGGTTVLLTCGASILVALVAAMALSALAALQFDRLVGRPWRPPVDERPPHRREVAPPKLASEPAK